jgi:hypothetical protein
MAWRGLEGRSPSSTGLVCHGIGKSVNLPPLLYMPMISARGACSWGQLALPGVGERIQRGAPDLQGLPLLHLLGDIAAQLPGAVSIEAGYPAVPLGGSGTAG